MRETVLPTQPHHKELPRAPSLSATAPQPAPRDPPAGQNKAPQRFVSPQSRKSRARRGAIRQTAFVQSERRDGSESSSVTVFSPLYEPCVQARGIGVEVGGGGEGGLASVSQQFPLSGRPDTRRAWCVGGRGGG